MSQAKTKQQAYKDFDCWHCVYRDSESGMCLAGDPESYICSKTQETEDL